MSGRYLLLVANLLPAKNLQESYLYYT